MRRLLILLAIFTTAACDESSGGPPKDHSRPHVAATGAPTFDEAAESTNAGTDGAEPTGYTLDATGLVIRGTFEPSTATQDCFGFATGSATDIDVQLFVDGVSFDGDPAAAFLSLDAIADDGYSALTGNDYFESAWVQPGKAWRICVLPNASVAGEAYDLEIRAAP